MGILRRRRSITPHSALRIPHWMRSELFYLFISNTHQNWDYAFTKFAKQQFQRRLLYFITKLPSGGDFRENSSAWAGFLYTPTNLRRGFCVLLQTQLRKLLTQCKLFPPGQRPGYSICGLYLHFERNCAMIIP